MVWCEKKIAFICALGKFDDTRTDEEDSGKRATLFVWVCARKKTLIAWIMQTFAILWDLFTSFCLPVSYVFGYTNLRQRKSLRGEWEKRSACSFSCQDSLSWLLGFSSYFTNQIRENQIGWHLVCWTMDEWTKEHTNERALTSANIKVKSFFIIFFLSFSRSLRLYTIFYEFSLHFRPIFKWFHT